MSKGTFWAVFLVALVAALAIIFIKPESKEEIKAPPPLTVKNILAQGIPVDKPIIVSAGLVTPPSRDLSYSQLLSAQLPGMVGTTWKSGATAQDMMRLGTRDMG